MISIAALYAIIILTTDNNNITKKNDRVHQNYFIFKKLVFV